MSTAELVRLVRIRPADAQPDEEEQFDEKAEPRGLMRAAATTAAKEPAAREFVERGVRGGEHGGVGGDRDHAGCGVGGCERCSKRGGTNR